MISQIIWSSNIEAIVGSIKKSKNIFLSENLKTRDEVVNFSLEDRKMNFYGLCWLVST